MRPRAAQRRPSAPERVNPHPRGHPALQLAAMTLALACGTCSSQSGGSGPRDIALVPRLVSVPAGDVVRFAAVVRERAVGRASPTPEFRATGGTITSGGHYRAGSAPGIYRVTARAREEGATDTAVVLVTRPGARVYSTHFSSSERPISEGGRWLGGGSTGLDWTDVSTTPGLAIGHQVGRGFTDATAILTGAWGPDQTVAATVHTVRQNDECFQEVELRLRSALGPHHNRGYEISYKLSRTSDAYLIIVRWNGPFGDFTYLTNQHGRRFGIQEGDVVGASMAGNVITAYRNGVPMGQVRDSTFADGNPGMGFNLANAPVGCAGTNGDYGFTSFTAHD